MRKALSLVLALVMVLSLAACGAAPESSKPSESGSTPAPAAKLKIGCTIYKYDDNFMSFVRKHIENFAKDADVELEIQDSKNDPAVQMEQIDAMINKGVNVLAINMVDPGTAPTIIEKAKAANIPLILFNKENKEAMSAYDKVWYVGTASEESGIIQGEMVAKAWKEKSADWDKNKDGKMQYVLLKGEPGHPDAEARTKYAIDQIVKEGVQVEELELQTGMWDASKAKDLMQTWLDKHGDKIEMVICNNDGMALGAVEALKAAGYFKDGKYMPVVGVDAIPEALDLIKKGEMLGTVLNDALNQAKATVELAVNAGNGKDVLDGTSWKLDDSKAVRVPYVGINEGNMDLAVKAFS